MGIDCNPGELIDEIDTVVRPPEGVVTANSICSGERMCLRYPKQPARTKNERAQLARIEPRISLVPLPFSDSIEKTPDSLRTVEDILGAEHLNCTGWAVEGRSNRSFRQHALAAEHRASCE